MTSRGRENLFVTTNKLFVTESRRSRHSEQVGTKVSAFPFVVLV